MEFKFAALDSKRFNLRPTGSSVVLSAAGEKWSEPAEAAAADSTKGRDKQRLIQSSGPRIASGGKIGPAFKAEKSPKWLDDRSALFDRLLEKNAAQLAAAPKEPIAITLPDGAVKEGVSFQTTPMDIAQSISSSLAKKVIVAKVNYTRRLGAELNLVDPEEEDEPVDLSEALQCVHAEQQGELWDMTRPLEGDCKLSLLTFNDADGRTVFWHSSAHLLGECLEEEYGVKLCIGPPTEQGFYYDAYMGKDSINEADYKRIQQAAQKIIKEKQVYERVVLSKEEALELFADNPFKVQLITNKVPDGSHTTAYRCGKLVDLCRGPHIPSTANVKAFEVVRNSAAYWLGNAGNDSLQRVYAVSFPEAKLLKTWKKQMAEAKERDHRTLGQQYELFFFHELSPGCCFFLPNGAFIYNKLISFIRSEYRKRGFREVVTPNVFNIDLWKISGHAEHYLDNMFTFDAENQTFGLKPMNCPGHCLLFDHRVRSHRELPLRLADFGVLHRNEYSGALSGLTRVRRFQQDDAHIFCRKDQIEQEVRGALEFMESVYGTLGFTYELDLSTRPAKALGDRALWDEAEAMMKNALDQFGHKWALNPGDGAFYGPKIDIKVYDALGRRHQCATIQLDFQLPIRFKLKYKASDPTAGDGSGYERPVMVHRAILGSVERMMAVLLEHCGGKWPFWLSPRQAIVVPVAMEFMDYAHSVAGQIHAAGFECDVEDSTKTLQKKIRESQLAQYNFILVVGGDEKEGGTVNVRTRDNQRHGTKPLAELIAQFHKMAEDHE